MYLADGWQDFEILDAGNGDKLERWGSFVLLRPDPQAVWPMGEHKADAVYYRSQSGGGHWEFQRELPESWTIRYRGLTFIVRPTGFKHTGLFPEQAVNWDFMADRLTAWRKGRSEAPRVLNLFAYTGGATCACAKAGAQVVHVDAAKGMVAWAKDNAAASGLSDAPIRYGEMWKIETGLYELVSECAKLLSEDPCFFLINSYTTGLAPSVLKNVLTVALPQGHAEAQEVGLPIRRGNLVLPCGATGRWVP